VEDTEEKIEGLRAISQKYTPENMKYFDDAVKASIDRTMVIKIEIKEITAKRKKYDVNGDEMKWGRME
jgi:nitroimidazol reductase NimA-like FMN-containing flavoprotein (pyridoxamine 5'-phosphate oxidase superfamily)